jgi:anti-anti-sigma factor
MSVEFSERLVAPDIVVFEMRGRLNSGNRLGDVEYAARKIVSAGNRKLVLDISAIDYLDSAALGMLVFITSEIAREGGKAYVAGASPRVSEIFKICQAQVVLNLQESLDSALKAFGAG